MPFVGAKYKSNLSTKDIAKLVRKEIREKIYREYPGTKVSVRVEYFSGGSAINVFITDLPFNPIRPDFDPDNPSNPIDRTYQELKYVPEYLEIKKKIDAIVIQYKRDDSKPEVDYYNVNFYFHGAEVHWEKEKEWIEERRKQREARMSGEEVEASEVATSVGGSAGESTEKQETKKRRKTGKHKTVSESKASKQKTSRKREKEPKERILKTDMEAFQFIASKMLQKGRQIVVTGMDVENDVVEFRVNMDDNELQKIIDAIDKVGSKNEEEEYEEYSMEYDMPIL